MAVINNKIQVQERQSLFDLVIQTTGSLEGLFSLTSINPALNLQNKPAPGSLIKEPNTIIDKVAYEIIKNSVTNPVSAVGSNGDYNNDYNNDYSI